MGRCGTWQATSVNKVVSLSTEELQKHEAKLSVGEGPVIVISDRRSSGDSTAAESDISPRLPLAGEF